MEAHMSGGAKPLGATIATQVLKAHIVTADMDLNWVRVILFPMMFGWNWQKKPPTWCRWNRSSHTLPSAFKPVVDGYKAEVNLFKIGVGFPRLLPNN